MTRRRDKHTGASKPVEPRELTRFEKTLLHEADRMLTVRTDGKTEQITADQAAARRAFQKAIEGSPQAMGHIFHSVAEAQRLQQSLIREDIKKGTAIKKWREERLEKAVRDGADAVWVVPHPDDIVINDEGWTVTGPMDEDELKPFRQSVAMREVLLLQSVLDERLSNREGSLGSSIPFDEAAGSTSLVFARLLDQSLPARFHLSDTQIMLEIMRYQRYTKRELLKAARASWALIKQPKPRGWILPPWRDMRPGMNRLMQIMNEAIRCIRSGRLESEKEVEELLRTN